MRESILETKPWIPADATAAGSLTTAVGSNAATGLVGGVAGDIIFWTDDAGAPRMGQLSAANVFYDDALSVATAVTATKIVQAAGTSNWFKSDNTLLKAPLIHSDETLNNFAFLYAPDLAAKFINVNEGVRLKSVYVRLPYQYTMADTPLRVRLSYIDNAGAAQTPVETVGEGFGDLYIPTENIEVPLDIYVPPLPLATLNYQLAVKLQGAVANVGSAVINPYASPAISQVDAPAVFNNLFLPITIGFRILHADNVML